MSSERVISLSQRAPYLCKMTIFGDEPRLMPDIAVEITQTCGLAASAGPTEDKQGDNGGQRRNAACVDGQHSNTAFIITRRSLYNQSNPDLFLARWIAEMLPFIGGKHFKIMIKMMMIKF